MLKKIRSKHIYTAHHISHYHYCYTANAITNYYYRLAWVQHQSKRHVVYRKQYWYAYWNLHFSKNASSFKKL